MLIPTGNRPGVSDSNITEPTGQTMNGWKQIGRFVYSVEESDELYPDILIGQFRSDIGSWKQNKKQKAYQLCAEVCCKEAEAVFCIHPGDETVIDCPEQITSEINQDKRRHKRNLAIQEVIHTIMIPVANDQAGTTIN